MARPHSERPLSVLKLAGRQLQAMLNAMPSSNRGSEASCSGRSTQLQSAKLCQLHDPDLQSISRKRRKYSREGKESGSLQEAKRLHAVLGRDLVELIGSTSSSVTPLADFEQVDDQGSRDPAEILQTALQDGWVIWT